MKHLTSELLNNPKICIFLDTETTGIEEEDRLIEVAYSAVQIDENQKLKIKYKENLYNTNVPINPAASAIHGYGKWHIENKPFFRESLEYNELLSLNQQNAIFIAHNSPFDLGMLEKEGISWTPENIIDTLRVSRHLIKNSEVKSHSLQYLRYFFELDLLPEFKKLKQIMNIEKVQPHTALSDIFVLMLFVEFLIKEYSISIENMLKLSKTPILYANINFGNVFEKETPFKEIINCTYEQYGRVKTGISYLTWAVENMDNLDFDKKHSIKHWLGIAYMNNPIPELKKYFDYGMFLSFNKEEFEKGLMYSKKPKEYYLLALASKINSYEKKEQLTDKEKFLHLYIKYVRMPEIYKF